MTEHAKKLLWLYHEQSKKNRTIQGFPPLTFKGKGKDLKNYRIYGNTVNGESVGDRTANLFDTQNIVALYHDAGHFFADNASLPVMCVVSCVGRDYISVKSFSDNAPLRFRSAFSIDYPAAGVSYLIDGVNTFINNDGSTWLIREVPEGAKWFSLAIERYSGMTKAVQDIINHLMIVGNNTLPKIYEPYGYRVPVTVTNGTDALTTNIYLPEQIRKVGDEAEYVDYQEQKQHFADGTSADVELPALPTIAGTNTLSVGTTVQPSEVEIKGKIKAVQEGGGQDES